MTDNGRQSVWARSKLHVGKARARTTAPPKGKPTAVKFEDDLYSVLAQRAIEQTGLTEHLKGDLGALLRSLASTNTGYLLPEKSYWDIALALARAAQSSKDYQEDSPSYIKQRNVLKWETLRKNSKARRDFMLSLRNEGISQVDTRTIVDAVFNLSLENRNLPVALAQAVSKVWTLARSSESTRPPLSKMREQLPQSAPEIWAKRVGRSENAIEFLKRVWGPYMQMGILYQDDIKRLGDAKLVQAVRDRCIAEGIDAASVLPPPGSQRWEDIAGHLTNDEIEAAYRLGAKRHMRKIRQT